MRRFTKHCIIVAILAATLMLILTGSTAFANDTPNVCDDNAPPKYYCTSVNYDANVLGGWNINHRYFEGAIDGGARQWQLWYAKDWYWNGSNWVLQTDWGSSAWYTNVNFDVWREMGSAVSISYYGTVTMRVHFYECAPSCYYWCGYAMEHDLWTGSSYWFGRSDCVPM